MGRNDDSLWCDRCGVEITLGAVKSGELIYCCQDCFEGRPCHCGERMDIDDDRRAPGTEIGESNTPA